MSTNDHTSANLDAFERARQNEEQRLQEEFEERQRQDVADLLSASPIDRERVVRLIIAGYLEALAEETIRKGRLQVDVDDLSDQAAAMRLDYNGHRVDRMRKAVRDALMEVTRD